jgi:hypothetical protein
MEKARDWFHRYLTENDAAADALGRMRHVIAEFSARAPRLVAMSCIDGRVHGSANRGYPPTTVRVGRTEGNNVSLERGNFWYWNRIDRAVADAHVNTPETPAVFIAFMHHSPLGHGCAAHKSVDAAALAAVERQVAAVRQTYTARQLYTILGDTNTDTMAERLVFEGGEQIDADAVIRDGHLRLPRDVFDDAFLTRPFDDVATARDVGQRTPDELLAGFRPAFFEDFEVCLDVQSYLLREISSRAQRDRGELRRLVRADVLDGLLATLDRASLPSTLVGPILYQVVWNVAYALYQTNLLEHLPPDEVARQIDHAEELVCYGDGFGTLPRNRCVLVKRGRGNDGDALAVAREVMRKNRLRHPQDHPPLVHLNVEVNGQMVCWNDFNDNVGAHLWTMLRAVDEVYGQDVALLTTYSYRDEKRFYPVRILADDPRLAYPTDVLAEINSSLKFSLSALKDTELRYDGSFGGADDPCPAGDPLRA